MGPRPGDPQIRLVLADAEAMVRAGLRLVLEAEPDIVVAAEVADGVGAARSALTLAPDVVVLDAHLPCGDGVRTTQRLADAGSRAAVLLLASDDEEDLLFRALGAGVSGFLPKRSTAAELVAAVRTLAAGEALLSPRVTRRVIDSFAGRSPPSGQSLTPREGEVLRLLARGLSNAEIARRLVLGDATVKTHVARVLTKLDVPDRTRAVVYAYEHGLVSPADGVR